jgi:cytidyltransferase-like protein
VRVITLGTFDTLHPGHIHLFRESARFAGPGGSLTVAVNSDEFVQAYKGKLPVQSVDERVEVVQAIRFVDRVFINSGGDAQPELIKRVKAEVIVIGDDWAPPRDYLSQIGVDQAWLDREGIWVEYLVRLGDLSSTRLKQRIRA